MASYNFLTDGRKKVIQNIANKIKESGNPIDAIIDDAGNFVGDIVTTLNGTQFTNRTTFPGCNGNGPYYNASALPSGGQNKTEIENCVASFFSNDTVAIDKFYKFYTGDGFGHGGQNAYCNGRSGIFPYESDGRKTATWGKWVGNCTAYAWGRFAEILSELNPNVSVKTLMDSVATGDGGKSFYTNTDDDATYYKKYIAKNVKTPPVGSIICYESIGHVAIVEKVEGKKVFISQSSYSKSGAHKSQGDGRYGCLFQYFETTWDQSSRKLGSGFLGTQTVYGFIAPR